MWRRHRRRRQLEARSSGLPPPSPEISGPIEPKMKTTPLPNAIDKPRHPSLLISSRRRASASPPGLPLTAPATMNPGALDPDTLNSKVADPAIPSLGAPDPSARKAVRRPHHSASSRSTCRGESRRRLSPSTPSSALGAVLMI
nr:uncharacterized protein LOC107278978 isoform X1 [Oryza sativa Japonica Group]